MTEIALIYVKAGQEAWSKLAQEIYIKKIQSFRPYNIIEIKTDSSSRDEKTKKIFNESEKILKKISDQDFVVLFDEKGFEFSNSIKFSKKIQWMLELGKKRLVFIIGGAFGFHEKINLRADYKIKLSSLTMNHHVARLMFQEQLYRSMMIAAGLPYHND